MATTQDSQTQPEFIPFGPPMTAACFPFDMPYTPYTKQDKLGRVADWLNDDTTRDSYQQRQQNAQMNKNKDQRGNKDKKGASSSDSLGQAFGYQHTEDESSFSLVDLMGKTTNSNATFNNLQGKPRSGPAQWVRTMSRSLLTANTRRPKNASNTQQRSMNNVNNSRNPPSTSTDRRGPMSTQPKRYAAAAVSGSSFSFASSASSSSSTTSSSSTSMSTSTTTTTTTTAATTTTPATTPKSSSSSTSSTSSITFTTSLSLPDCFLAPNPREPSIPVGTNWSLVHEFDLNKMSKLQGDLPTAQTLATFGSLNSYSKAFDKVTCKSEVLLQRPSDMTSSKISTFVSTLSDPNFKTFSKQRPQDVATVYATDALMALLMACPRSMYAWDMLVTRVGEHSVYLDRRPNNLVFESMNENAPNEPHSDLDKELNSPARLTSESTYINWAYKTQVLNASAPKKKMGASVPFPQAIPSTALVYREFSLGALTFLARTEVDAYLTHANREETTLIRALNHVPGLVSNLDWKRQLDSQRGTVTATEIRNNAYKVARWTLQAILSDAQWMRIGFVSRSSFKDPTRHSILGCSSYRPAMLASQMNLSLANAWAVVSHIVDIALQQPEGHYVLVKDPNQSTLRFFSVPEGVNLMDSSSSSSSVNTQEVSQAPKN